MLFSPAFIMTGSAYSIAAGGRAPFAAWVVLEKMQDATWRMAWPDAGALRAGEQLYGSHRDLADCGRDRRGIAARLGVGPFTPAKLRPPWRDAHMAVEPVKDGGLQSDTPDGRGGQSVYAVAKVANQCELGPVGGEQILVHERRLQARSHSRQPCHEVLNASQAVLRLTTHRKGGVGQLKRQGLAKHRPGVVDHSPCGHILMLPQDLPREAPSWETSNASSPLYMR